VENPSLFGKEGAVHSPLFGVLGAGERHSGGCISYPICSCISPVVGQFSAVEMWKSSGQRRVSVNVDFLS
jgi:hypothetical protein